MRSWIRCKSGTFFQEAEPEDPEFPYDLAFIDPVNLVSVIPSGLVFHDAIALTATFLTEPLPDVLMGSEPTVIPARMEPSVDRALKNWLNQLGELKYDGGSDEDAMEQFEALSPIMQELTLDGLALWIDGALPLPFEEKFSVVIHESHPDINDLEEAEVEWLSTDPTVITDDRTFWRGIAEALNHFGVAGCRLPR